MKPKNKIDVLLGLQWGDEGKGKIIDVLTPKYDIIARFQGGPNAGHTIEFNEKKHVLHMIPSGIFYEEKINFLGNGMVIDPFDFQQEIQGLLAYISMEQLKKSIVIADGASIILPTHRLLDKAMEAAKSNNKIGSTLKGIGPTYTDKISRHGLRIGHMLTENFIEKYTVLKERHLKMIAMENYEMDDERVQTLTKDEEKFFQAINFLKEFTIKNGPNWINDQIDAGKKVLAEGAQGTLLDIDFGESPFVTSSNTTIGGICTGLGVAANRIGNVYGLFKAYCTRVGNGPFPTELGRRKSEEWCATHTKADEDREYPYIEINNRHPKRHDHDFVQGIALRRKGNEYGATTGRPRRCGWLDLPLLKYACMINGTTDLVMSKADVLSNLETVKVCIDYNKDGTPIYKEFEGWKDDLQCNTCFLPQRLKDYMKFIETETETKITIISTGPNREQIRIGDKI